MKYTLQIKDFEMTAQDFATVLYDFLWVDYSNFKIECPDEFEHLLVGECWEDKLANVLWNVGYLWVYNDEECDSDKDSIDNVSDVLDIDHCEFDEDYQVYSPVYKLTRERVEEAFKQMIINDSPQANEVHHSFVEIFEDKDGNPDFYDSWNIFQYILFGEVVYG